MPSSAVYLFSDISNAAVLQCTVYGGGHWTGLHWIFIPPAQFFYSILLFISLLSGVCVAGARLDAASIAPPDGSD